MGKIIHLGVGSKPEELSYRKIIEKYATSIDYEYIGFGIDCDFFKSSDIIKHASLCVMWNGSQGKTPLCAKLCRKRSIPHVFFEWGMLPQSTTFMVDPKGFCGDSILNDSLHWVTNEDKNNLKIKRAELQCKYPIKNEGFILVPLQVEADSQILYHSIYNSMAEFISHVEDLYPNDRIIVRPHPKGRKIQKTRHAEVVYEGDFLSWASRASRVVGITSTCLYEAGVLGVPIVAMGDHPLRSHHPKDIDDVLAGALALTLDRNTGDFGSILERFNIKPL